MACGALSGGWIHPRGIEFGAPPGGAARRRTPRVYRSTPGAQLSALPCPPGGAGAGGERPSRVRGSAPGQGDGQGLELRCDCRWESHPAAWRGRRATRGGPPRALTQPNVRTLFSFTSVTTSATPGGTKAARPCDLSARTPGHSQAAPPAGRVAEGTDDHRALGEAGATSSPPLGPPTAGDRSADTPTGGSQSQGPLPGSAVSAEQQDVGPEPLSAPEDKDKSEAAGGRGRERPEEVTPLGPQEPRQERLTEGAGVTRGTAASPGGAQAREETPHEASVAHGQAGPAPAPFAETPASGATDRPRAEDPAPASPGPAQGALRTWPLDPSQYAALEENDYMQSVTSLLGGGEGAIGPLADVLVWPEATVGMGLALGLLATGHASPSDLLSAAGPGLRSVSSILGSASFFPGLMAGAGWALRSIAQTLGTVEQSTREGLRSAVRHLAGHLCPRGAPAAPSGG
ncbi:PREDICTED: uncharacterized protein C2orf57 homolog [Chinchilla lanigera]|uniref:uncharacterized protein C2orf57 homolog n=1 Tax=Chinchilla lanigera TaxID=34839 RepID=UPI0006963687|nr:PREDICTED: uncharacterized protein C2orf57 homolog [Chinchilla lanigera]